MKLFVNCMKCFHDQGYPSEVFYPVEVNDSGVLFGTCPKGHKTATILQQQKFEILFDFGSMALVDGYPREAITSIVASLERFYEFYIDVILIKHNIDKNSISYFWKYNSLSERQFGAFTLSHLLNCNTEYIDFIDNQKPVGYTKTLKNVRNEVVHNGYMPSTDEASAYIDLCYKYLNKMINQLITNESKSVETKVLKEMLSRSKLVEKGMFSSTISIPTIVSLIQSNQRPENYKDALDEFVDQYMKFLHNK